MIVSGGAEEKPFETGNKYLFMVITSAEPLSLGRGRGSQAEGPARQDRDGLLGRSVLEGGAGRGAQQAKEGRPRRRDGRILLAVAPPISAPIVNKIVSSNADAFIGGGHYSDGATLARQIHDQKAN